MKTVSVYYRGRFVCSVSTRSRAEAIIAILSKDLYSLEDLEIRGDLPPVDYHSMLGPDH